MKSFLGNFYRHLAIFSGHTRRRRPHRRLNCNLKQMTFTANRSDSELNKSQNGVRMVSSHLSHTFSLSFTTSLFHFLLYVSASVLLYFGIVYLFFLFIDTIVFLFILFILFSIPNLLFKQFDCAISIFVIVLIISFFIIMSFLLHAHDTSFYVLCISIQFYLLFFVHTSSLSLSSSQSTTSYVYIHSLLH